MSERKLWKDLEGSSLTLHLLLDKFESLIEEQELIARERAEIEEQIKKFQGSGDDDDDQKQDEEKATDDEGRIRLRIRLTAEHEAEIKEAAERCGISITAWVRSRLLQCARKEKEDRK